MPHFCHIMTNNILPEILFSIITRHTFLFLSYFIHAPQESNTIALYNWWLWLTFGNGINIDGLKEVLDEYDDYRLSKIWIGLSNTIKSESFNNNIKEIKEKLIDYDVKVTSVGKVFDEYLEYIEKTLE